MPSSADSHVRPDSVNCGQRQRIHALTFAIALLAAGTANGIPDAAASWEPASSSVPSAAESAIDHAQAAYELARFAAHRRMGRQGHDAAASNSAPSATTAAAHPDWGGALLLPSGFGGRDKTRALAVGNESQGTAGSPVDLKHHVPFLPSASCALVRVVNRDASAGHVSIVAIDDAGQQFGPILLAIRSLETVHVDVPDLQYGNAAKGLAQGVGLPTEGDWRLELTSALDIRAAAYSCSTDATDGLLASLHGRVPKRDGMRQLPLFGATSLLRLVNPGDEAATATIRGVNERGVAGAGEVRATIPPRASRTLRADDLQAGNSALDGALGDGGNWRLAVSANRPVQVAHLLPVPSGLANASTELAWHYDGGHRVHRVPYFPTASAAGVGVVRFVNDSNVAGTVEIRAFDQTAQLSVGARQAVQFDATELAQDLSGGQDDGVWRLELATTLNGRASAYFRHADGQLADLTPTVTEAAASSDERASLLFFAAADSPRRSLLHLVNWNDEDADVTATGRDEGGNRSDVVRINVPAQSARTFDARQLETGAAPGLSGGLGEGAGSWRLDIASNLPLQILNLLERNGQLANLSRDPLPEDTSAAGIFAAHISAIVQNRCVRCHVAGGRAAGARLRFIAASDAADHQARNIEALQTFLAEVPDAAAVLLNRVQGIGHGGGVQIAADTEDHAHMARLLTRLGEEPPAPPSAPSASRLFDGVQLETPRRTLRRAALIFAGRIPTAAEYAALDGGGSGALRRALRGLMTGDGFHDFLLRASNDRLLTDRELNRFSVIGNDGFFVAFDDAYIRLQQGDENEFRDWHRAVQHGAARAPLELIAHVAENDLPYTTVLTADYIMANPQAARAYGAPTAFNDRNDVHEFKPTTITGYYRHGEGYRQRYIPGIGVRVVDPGPLRTNLPHAGVLSTKAFLQRYPTTATNRNRARSRWTYYHFLGVDVEQSASRTTDPAALADTDNPTLKNPACTVCHEQLDPVAGAFQNYGDSGYYRDQWGGLDSLDYFYKHGADHAKEIRGESAADRSTLVWTLRLAAGRSTLGFAYTNDFYMEETGDDSSIHLDYLRVLDEDGVEVARLEFEDAADDCGEAVDAAENEPAHLLLWGGGHECAQHLQVDAAHAGVYTVEVVAWGERDDRYGGEGFPKVSVVADPYRVGDTWYRDMRDPGFRDDALPDSDDSLAWLARRIVAQDDFATAAVKFWWPAVMGSEVAEPPQTSEDADFEGRLLAATSQESEVQRLASGFRNGFGSGAAYNLKDLLVELALSVWFRADSATDLDAARTVALANAGAKRLLTPEELSRKTAVLTGVEWGRQHYPTAKPHRQHIATLTDERQHRLLYGGIDSDGITARARDMTSVMAGVAQAHAAQVSCPVVLREFYLLPANERRLFGGIEAMVSPRFELGATFEATETKTTHTLRGELAAGVKTVFLRFPNDLHEPPRDRNLFVDRLDVLNSNGDIVQSVELETLAAQSDCVRPEDDHYAFFCDGRVEIPVAIDAAGSYALEIVAWGDLHGDEAPLLDVVVNADATTAVGEAAIKGALVALHEKLLGVALSVDADDIATAYQLFKEVWERKRENADKPWLLGSQACEWTNDIRFLDGFLANAVRERVEPHGPTKRWNETAITSFWDRTVTWDEHFAARTWVVVLAYLLMDYRYLHL